MVGDPIAMYITERTPDAAIAGIRLRYGLDEPEIVQYFIYLTNLFKGDWGLSTSIGADQPVLTVLARLFPATIELAIIAMILAVILGIPLGIISATKKDKVADHVTRVFALTGVSMPIFWFGLMLKYVLFYQLSIHDLPNLPGGDRYNIRRFTYTPTTGFLLFDSLLIEHDMYLFVDAVVHLIMPAFCLGYITLAIITRMMRSSMLEVIKEDYITLAKSKGLTERIVIYRHALRNALIPTVTVIGLAFGGLMTGAVLTETIFNWPGLGRWAVRAILNSDMAAINGFTLLVAFIFVTANLIVDLIYGILDPRIRFG